MGSDHRRLYYQLDVPVGFGPEPAGPRRWSKALLASISPRGTRFIAFLPLGILLILAMPLLAYWFYPPEVKVNNEVPLWAARELEKLGKLSRNEILLLVFVCFALMMWIFAADWIEPALAALLVIVLMLWTGVLSSERYHQQQSGMEHLCLVRHPGGTGRRPLLHRLYRPAG